MPTVFQTGEREGRPLFPDRLYYTTPQKVADILQIPLPTLFLCIKTIHHRMFTYQLEITD